MEIKITDEKENSLFDRKEILGYIESKVVPSRAQVLEILSKKFSIPIENIKVKKILGKFGSKKFEISANIYSSKENKDSIELMKKKDKELEKKIAESKEGSKEDINKTKVEKTGEKPDIKSKQKENPDKSTTEN